MGSVGSIGIRVKSVKLDETIGIDQISEGGLRLIKLDVRGWNLPSSKALSISSGPFNL